MPEEKVRLSFAEFFECPVNTPLLIQLGGYNNTNFKVLFRNKTYFAKFENRDAPIIGSSLQNEVVCMNLIQHAGISPPLVFFDPKRAVMITKFIDGNFNIDLPKAKQRYVTLLKQLHNLDIQFPNTFHPIETLKTYERLAKSRDIDLPTQLVESILPVVYAFNEAKLFTKAAPCHLDPQFANVIGAEDNLYFVDWEFSAMSEPLFDLASMCASEHFSNQDMRDVLSLYLERSPTEKEWNRFNKIRVIADLRMCLFCLLYTSITKDKVPVYQNFANKFLNSAAVRLQNCHLLFP